MGMLQDLKWDTLETIRGHARLSVMYKICYGFLDRKWEDYLIPNRERRTRGSHDLRFIVPEGHKDIFRFFFISHENNRMEQTFEKTGYLSISLYFKSTTFGYL